MDIKQHQDLAKSRLIASSKEIQREYTFGWIGPIERAIEVYPFIREGLAGIENDVADLPVCVFLERKERPSQVIAVVPYKTPDGISTNTRALHTDGVPEKALHKAMEFSQAFLFLVSSEALPSPMDQERMTAALISLTDRKLVSL